MPGGPAEAYAILEPMLDAIAAKTEDGACVTHIGPGGAGHYVKMVHNGIEYGDMQLIAETYDIMRRALGMTRRRSARSSRRWNKGKLDSFLIEITAEVLGYNDPDTGKPLVDLILDTAEQKGTGRWTSRTRSNSAPRSRPSMPPSSPAPSRPCKAQRVYASNILTGPAPTGEPLPEAPDRRGARSMRSKTRSISPRSPPTPRAWRSSGRHPTPTTGT